MANVTTLEFAGDATKLSKAAKQAEGAITPVGDAATRASDDMVAASRSADTYSSKVGQLGAGVTGMTDAVDSASAAVQGLADLQNSAADRAQRHARALHDVKQAQQDANQAVRDSKQAAIDSGQAVIDEKQARLDAQVAQKDYNKAVKEHGKNSDEAKQALLDMEQAQQDVKQAQEDSKQAQEDVKQATLDAEGAQLDLNDAQKEANPTDLQKFATQLQTVTPILTGLIGIVGLVTAAQWAWNAAQLASPTTWIVIAIIALIGVIVLIATKTTWFQDAWKAAWRGIKAAASAVGSWFKDTLWGKWIKGAWEGIKSGGEKVWNWLKALPGKLKSVFSKVGEWISAPFRSAFNAVSSAWNNTVGRLSWTVPGWVPLIGGYSVSAPQLPKFHDGGTVPGAPGSEMLAILQAGETVIPASGNGGETVHVVVRIDRDVLVEAVTKGVRRRGGDVQGVLGHA